MSATTKLFSAPFSYEFPYEGPIEEPTNVILSPQQLSFNAENALLVESTIIVSLESQPIIINVGRGFIERISLLIFLNLAPETYTSLDLWSGS